MRRIALILAWTCVCAGTAFAQGSQRQGVSVSPEGTPVAGASVWACQAGSTPSYTATPPCTLVNIYSDPSLGSSYLITQPLISDGLGNYTYYTAAGAYVEVITGSNVTGYSSTVVLPCAPNSSAAGCSGGAGNPAGVDTQVQINSHGEFGAVAGLAVNSSTSPSVLSLPFSESVEGPRPRVDVTAYGADPTGTADSTTAITNAAAAACSAGSTLFFPPGTYSLTQPQSPSTSAVIPIPCAHIHISALGDQGTAQSEQPPQAKLVVANLGASPNSAPVFGFKYPTNTGDITIEDIQVSGYNQALLFYAVTNITLNNVCATAQSTSLADNVPLKITNVSWFRMNGGCLNSGTSSLPMALFTGEAPLASESPAVAYAQIEHVRGSGANFQYIQRVNTSGSGPGNLFFNDVTPISGTTDFFEVTNATGSTGQTALPQFGPIFFLNTSMPGSTGSGALINFNSSGSNLAGVHIQNSTGSGQGSPPAAIRMTAGSLQDCEVHGTVGALVEDSSGNPTGSCSVETRGGLDFVADSTIAPSVRLRSEETTGANPTPSLRFYLSPNSRASYGIDAGQGLLFNDGTSNGFNGSLSQTRAGAIDIQFAYLFPPTNVTGAATTGGAIPAGTYYPIVGTTSNNCATVSAPSLAGAPVTLSGSNNAVSVSWTTPLQGAGAINGYCVAIASSAAAANAGLSYAGVFASGSTTTNATITAVLGGMQFAMGNAMNSLHRFTPTGLNLNGGVNFYADSGAANAYAILTSPAIATIPVGTTFTFQAAHANTGSSTLNVDSLGAVTIKKNGGTGSSVGSNLVSGDVAAGQLVQVQYDGTNFELQSTLGNPSSFSCGALGTLLTGDVANSNCATTVKQIQGVPVSATAPLNGQILVDKSGTWTPTAPLQCEDAQTGTTYTVAYTDGGCVVKQSNAGTITTTVPAGTATGFGQGFYFEIYNNNAVGSPEVDVTSSANFNVMGQTETEFVIYPQEHAYFYCNDGTNWVVFLSRPANGLTFYAETYYGASVDVKWNACNTLAAAVHGTCDGTALVGNQAIDATLYFGDSSYDATHDVLPAQGFWSCDMTNNTDCVDQYAGSDVEVGSVQGSPNFYINVPSCASNPCLSHIYQSLTGTGGYLHLGPVKFSNATGSSTSATSSGIGVLFTHLYDQSLFEGNVSDNWDTYGIEVHGACCGSGFRHVDSSARNTSGSTTVPLYFLTDSSTTANNAFVCESCTITGPGAGYASILAVDTEYQSSTLVFDNLYEELSTTDEQTTPNQFQGIKMVTVNGATIKAEAPNGTLTITNTALTSNVATYTYTLSSGSDPVANQQVTVTGTTNGSGVFNVTSAIITGANSSTFTVAITHTNVSSASDSGTAGVASSAAAFSVSNSGNVGFALTGVQMQGTYQDSAGPYRVMVNANARSCPGTCTIWADGHGNTPSLFSEAICTSSASPAACGSAAKGAFVIAASASSVVVDTTDAPNDTSNITITPDLTLGSRLSVTCNTTPQFAWVSAVTPGTSFTVSVGSNFSTNPGCYTFHIKKG